MIMADRNGWVRAAARNNAEWCDAVCRAHGLQGEFRADAWVSAHRTPPLYPDAVTLTADTSAREVLARIDVASPGCSIKDSFACLDLSPAGFEVLFDAQWIYRPADRPAPTPPEGIRWDRVQNTGDLVAWEAAWNGDQGITGLFRPALLTDDTAFFLAGYAGGQVVAGAVASRTESVVGISNLFTSDDDLEGAWAGCLAAVVGMWPGVPVFGYEHGEDLEAAVRQDCVPIGPVRVWVRTG